MRRNTQLAISIAVLAAVCVIAWLWLQQRPDTLVTAGLARASDQLSVGPDASNVAPSANNAPSAGKSGWDETFASARGKQDARSLETLFKRANDCLLYARAKDRVDELLVDERWKNLSDISPERLQRLDTSSAKAIRVVQELGDYCRGSDPAQLAQASSDALFAAAMQGSAVAENCFFSMGPSAWGVPRTALEKQAEMERYLKYAPDFRQRSLERGDTLLVNRTLFEYTGTAMDASPMATLRKADPTLAWRSARLASLRALPDQRTSIEAQLERFRTLGLLSPPQIAAADSWAKDAYQRDYSGKPAQDIDSDAQCFASHELVPLD